MDTTEQRQILVTAALLYANGPLHLGHLVGYIQADIWVRYQRMRDHDCLYICGSDAHGTPIMIKAQKDNIEPEQLINQMRDDHMRDFDQFFVEFDNFYTTHSPENRELSELIYQRLNDKGDIFTKTISQAFDPEQNMFLPDRFIRGTCPRCGATDQHGDSCEVCGATYTPTELVDAVSAVSGSKPITKESEHLFFALDHYQDLLKKWTGAGHLQTQIANKLQEWFTEGLKAWDISRDAPYFGFEIPGVKDKYFYVWLDAPIGYMASLKNLSDTQFDHYWQKDSSTELYHFIGKDIVYFHALFWPAILSGADFRLPTAIYVNGFLTINGQKMSKSRGTFITAEQYLQHLNPEYLRYYYAAKLGPQVEDIDLNLEDFMQRVNSDLVGKYINLASRCAGFITQKFDGQLADALPNSALWHGFIAESKAIGEHYESRDYNKAVRAIMALADQANQYIDHEKPWQLAKGDGKEKQIQAVCTQGLNLFKVLTTYLQPILPETAQKVGVFLNCELTWEGLDKPLCKHKINTFKPLLQRITPEAIESLAS